MLYQKKRLSVHSIFALVLLFLIIYLREYLKLVDETRDLVYAVKIKSKPKAKDTFQIVDVGDRRKLSSNFVTIVTIYFQLTKSKHSTEEYNEWIIRMLNSLHTSIPLVAFVDQKSSTRFIQLIEERHLIATIFIADSIWDVVKELEEIRNRSYLETYLLEQKKSDRDPQRNLHHQDLYAVWNMKTFLVNKTSLLNPFNSKFFIYTDIGAWRGKQFLNWPDLKFVENLSMVLNDRMLYGQVHNLIQNGEFKVTNNVIQGTFFAGSIKAISLIYENYFELHDQMIDQGLYIGKEQNQMNILTFYKLKEKIVRLKTFNLNCSIMYDYWFFYQYYFASPEDYICSEDKFSILYFE